MRESAILVALGAVLGLALSVLAARWVSTLLFGLSPSDPLTLGVSTAALGAVAACASYLPARRAARVSPMMALRDKGYDARLKSPDGRTYPLPHGDARFPFHRIPRTLPDGDSCIAATERSESAARQRASRNGGYGIIRGRVTDRETGQPLARVMVTLTSTVWREQTMSSAMMTSQTGIADDSSLTRNPPRRTITAADGRFELTRIPPGAYIVSFDASMTRGTRLDQSFGENAPRDPLKPGRRAPPIEIRNGETRENIDVALWRAFAIEGRVLDDAGEPVANTDV